MSCPSTTRPQHSRASPPRCATAAGWPSCAGSTTCTNELFAIPLHAFGAYTRLPGPAAGDLFFDPQQVAELLSGVGWEDIQIDAVSEPAWMGSDVADVMSYVRGMPMIRSLSAELGDEAQTERVLATVAEQYAARQRPDGRWVRAAAWLVTARRA